MTTVWISNCISQEKELSLAFLSVTSRPDIAFAVRNLARFTSKPTIDHWIAFKRVLCYLQGTTNHGILYNQKDSEECVGFSDSDSAGDTCNVRNPLLDTCFTSAEAQSLGEARNKAV